MERKLVVSLIALCILASLAFYYVFSAYYFSRSLHSTASVKSFGDFNVYWGSNCSSLVTNIDWGVLSPGENSSKTVYLRNEGNTAIILSMNTSGWSPAQAQSYISVSWNYSGLALDPLEIVPVSFELQVDPKIMNITSFDFYINLYSSW